MDYFYFFFHLGLDLLRQGGALCFITTNYYLTATYAKNLRGDLMSRATISTLLNFSDLKIFESAAGQHNLITLLVKGKAPTQAKTLIARTDGSAKASDDFLEAIFDEDPEFVSTQFISQVELASRGQFRLTNAESHAIEGVLDVLPQSNQVVGLHFNVLTGAQTQADKVSRAHARKFGRSEVEVGNGIFVVSGDELRQLNLDDHEMEIVKPWFKNSDVRRYELNSQNDEFVIFADKRVRSLETRPRLMAHLEKFRDIIDAASSNSPYMHRPRSINFDGPKLVTPYKTPGVRFAMAEGPWYASGDVYFITEKTNGISLWSLLAILNSDLLNAWYWLRGKRKGNLVEMYEEPLSATPLPPIRSFSTDEMAELEVLAKKIDREGKSMPAQERQLTESEINSRVCQLYGLTQDQVAVLNAWSSSWSNDPLRADS
jgi:adenine-specific DNA-methyltransferase